MNFQQTDDDPDGGIGSMQFDGSRDAGQNMGCVNTDSALKGREHAALTLVQDGHPVANIVIGEKASRAAQFAAAELQYHIEKITGARLPVVRMRPRSRARV